MSDETPMDEIDQGKIELIMALRRQGIRDKRVLNALERIPRESFINASFRKQAYEDHALPIEPTVVQRLKDLLAAGQAVSPTHTVELMQHTYRAFVHDNAARFGTLFAHLLDSDAPLVFHCTAGKDRTGFAAALILLALGVPRELVMQDYLLTNDYYRMPVFEQARVPPEVLNVLWRVQAEFLDAALHAVEQDYGGVDSYLSRELGVRGPERRRLAELYLEPAAG